MRQDILTGRWVITAQGRSRRPDEFRNPPLPVQASDDCPFCPGNENRTTPEILATGREPGPDASPSSWRIRVFANMYPALIPLHEQTQPTETEPLFPRWQGSGSHEVVAYTPDHQASLGSLPVPHIQELLEVIGGRITASGQANAQVRHVLPFCNHGPLAGATLAHPHLQILGSPLIPGAILEKSLRLQTHQKATGNCLVCQVIEKELKLDQRVVMVSDNAVALAPWASRFPYEVRILPRLHLSRLEETPARVLGEVSWLLQEVIARLEKMHNDLCYNVVIHSGALASDGTEAGDLAAGPDFHWHLEVLPRLARLAGFEAGSGFAINSISPEQAAARLRETS